MATTNTQSARRFAFLLAFAVAWLSIVGNVSAGEVAERSPNAAATCRLNIQGSPVEALTLIDEQGIRKHLQEPGSSVSLPAGRYRIERIELKNGFECYDYGVTDDSWFTLAPDKPHDLHLGTPFKAEVTGTRQGRIIVLSYELRGASGYKYVPSGRTIKPRFTVYRGDRMLGSDDFQYG
jgi:hypothetical protein